jgi:hypothetical protein
VVEEADVPPDLQSFLRPLPISRLVVSTYCRSYCSLFENSDGSLLGLLLLWACFATLSFFDPHSHVHSEGLDCFQAKEKPIWFRFIAMSIASYLEAVIGAIMAG